MGERAILFGPARESDMSTADVAAELGCSVRHANDLMPEMGAVNIGRASAARPTLRVAREDFEAWREKRKVAGAGTGSGSAGAFGGAASKGSAARRAARIARRRASQERDSSERPPIRLTQPRAARKSGT